MTKGSESPQSNVRRLIARYLAVPDAMPVLVWQTGVITGYMILFLPLIIRALVREEIAMVDAGEISVKGVHYPVRTYIVEP